MSRLQRKLRNSGLVLAALAALGCGATRPRMEVGKPWEVAAEAVNHVPLPVPVKPVDLGQKVVVPDNVSLPALHEKVTLRSDATDIRSLLLGLSKQTGLNITLDEEVQGTVSAYLNEVEVLQALRQIVTPLGFALEIREDGVRVYEPTVETRIYRLQYLRGERSGLAKVSMVDRSASNQASNPSTFSGGGGSGGGGSSASTIPGMSGTAPLILGGVSQSEVTSKFSVNFWEDLGGELESLVFDGMRGTHLVRNDRKEAGISIYEQENVIQGPGESEAPSLKPGEKTLIVDDGHKHKPPARRSLTIDSMSGTIVVRAKPDVLDAVGRYLKTMEDTLQRQVVVDVRILEVALSDEKHFGIDSQNLPLLPSDMIANQLGIGSMFGADDTVANYPRVSTPLGFPDPVSGNPPGYYPPLTSQTPNYGIVLGSNNPTKPGDYKVVINALAKLGDVKVVSAPRVSALHNQKAVVKIVRDRVFYLESAGQTALTNAGSITTQNQFVPIVVPEGVVLDMTPLIEDDGSVTLEIHPSFSVIFNEKAAPGGMGTQPEVERREFETTLHCKGEETVVLGGLITERSERKESGLPYLKDIPYLGNLFRHTDDVITKSEIIVLLTPRVQGASLAREMINHQAKMNSEDPPFPENDDKNGAK